MLSEGIATSRGRAGALLHRDGVNRRLRGRRGARLAALTSGGAIPDNANYDVRARARGDARSAPSTRTSPSRSWPATSSCSATPRGASAASRPARVRVEDAAGAPPTIPFWLGEGPARTRELSAEVAALREEIADAARARRATAAPALMVAAARSTARGAELLRDYVAAGAAALGAVPTQTRVIAERFFDEAGGMQLVIHAPFGGRINRAWGMALRKRFCRTFDFELQAAATDDGDAALAGPAAQLPARDRVLACCAPSDVDELLTQAALQAPMFGTRWRWNATRSLALLRCRGGQARAAATAAHARGGSARRGVPGAGGLPGQPRRRGDRAARPPAGARDPARLPDRGDGRRGPARACSTRSRPGEIQRRRARHARAVGVRARDPERQPVRLPRRRAARGAARARGRACGAGCPPTVVERDRRARPGGGRRRWSTRRGPTCAIADELHDCCSIWAPCPRRRASAAGSASCSTSWWRPAEPRGSSAAAGAALGGGRAALAGGHRVAGGAASSPTWWSRPRGARRPGPNGRARWSRWCARTSRSLGPTTAEAIAAPLGVAPVGDVEAALARLEMDGAVLRGRFCPRASAATRPRNGATGACSRASTAGRSTACGARSSRSAPPTSCASCSAGSTCARARSSTAAAGWPAVIGAAAGVRGRGRRVGARDPPGAPGRLRAGLAGRAVPLGRGGLGPAGGAAGGRHAQPRARPSPWCRRRRLPWLLGTRAEAGETARPLSAPARDVLRVPRADGRQLLRTNHRRRAPAACRGRGRALRAGLGGPGDG